MVNRPRPDECYRRPACDVVFVDNQIGNEQHLASEHGRLQDTLPSVRELPNVRVFNKVYRSAAFDVLFSTGM